jgi:tyrosyl-tRNA synthetase
MGGTDQWGNITAGVELIRRVEARGAFALTLPLVTKSDGSKFGKTETGTIWLDPARTSAYDMYQFWLNTADTDVIRFLKYFTFLRLADIVELEESSRERPEHREAQRMLARTVTGLVHGEAARREAEELSAALFGGRQEEGALLEGVVAPGAQLPNQAASWPLWKLLSRAVTGAGATMSTSEARRLIQQGGIEVDGRRATSIDQQTPAGPHTLKIGKRRIYRILIEGL